MKIVQVIPVVASAFGGPSIGSVELNRALNDLGAFAILLSSTKDSGRGRLSSTDVAAMAPDGVRLKVFPPSFPGILQHSWGLTRAIAGEVRDADLVHIHGQYLLPHVAAYVAAKRWRVPYGVQPHGGLEPYQRAKSRWRKDLYNWLIGNRILRGARYVQFASQSEADRAMDVVRASQVSVAPLGARLSDPSEIAWISEWLGSTRRESVFLFLGRLAHKKRPDLLLRAWAESGLGSRGAKLIVAGPDDDLTAEGLTALAYELDVPTSVRFAGGVSPSERSWLYARAAVFVLPSENENFALTVAEAMLAGCSVITTDQVASSEYVLAAGAGHVVSGLESLAATLTGLFDDPGAVRAQGARGRAYASEHLGWESLASCLMSKVSRGSE